MLTLLKMHISCQQLHTSRPDNAKLSAADVRHVNGELKREPKALQALVADSVRRYSASQALPPPQYMPHGRTRPSSRPAYHYRRDKCSSSDCGRYTCWTDSHALGMSLSCRFFPMHKKYACLLVAARTAVRSSCCRRPPRRAAPAGGRRATERGRGATHAAIRRGGGKGPPRSRRLRQRGPPGCAGAPRRAGGEGAPRRRRGAKRW